VTFTRPGWRQSGTGLLEMLDAADHDDAATVARFADMIAEKVEQELEWYAQDTATPVAPTPIITASHR
jgi:hypothetical protein